MKILSLYWGMCSSAALYADGKVIAAAHEERFDRKKNNDVFPKKAIDFCLKYAGISPSELDGVAIASRIQPCDDTLTRKYSLWTVEDYLTEQHDRWYPYFYENSVLRTVLDVFPHRIDLNQYPGQSYWKTLLKKEPHIRQKKFEQERERIVSEYLGIPMSKVKRIEHHRCHSYYAYYTSPFRGERVLCFTIDGYGDGYNATIGMFDELGHFSRVFETNSCNIGRIYRHITLLLGMKPNEHEYKVMGLAPYGKEKYARRAYEIFSNTLYVDDIEFKWRVQPTDSYFWFRDRLEGIRFDSIAWGLQKWTEELLVQWVRNAIRKYDISKVVISGGVAMNIKAMGRIASLPEVDDLFVGGSGSDESMAISAGICLAEDMSDTWDAESLFPVKNLYLGPIASFADEKGALQGLADSGKFEIIEEFDEKQIATLLVQGKILARCAGRMEFGQRALGNRSILADPINPMIKEKINKAIKNRDFWMPFAPVILHEDAGEYLQNPKGISSPYMTIGFNTTEKGYESMIAACHPADHSARPQILSKEQNPPLYNILKEFKMLTGRGALLNTSFNIHGEPIVNTPLEAIEVLQESGLDGLILNHYLILKKHNN